MTQEADGSVIFKVIPTVFLEEHGKDAFNQVKSNYLGFPNETNDSKKFLLCDP